MHSSSSENLLDNLLSTITTCHHTYNSVWLSGQVMAASIWTFCILYMWQSAFLFFQCDYARRFLTSNWGSNYVWVKCAIYINIKHKMSWLLFFYGVTVVKWEDKILHGTLNVHCQVLLQSGVLCLPQVVSNSNCRASFFTEWHPFLNRNTEKYLQEKHRCNVMLMMAALRSTEPVPRPGILK